MENTLIDTYNKYNYLQKLKEKFLSYYNNPTNFNRWLLANDEELKKILTYAHKEQYYTELIKFRDELKSQPQQQLNYKIHHLNSKKYNYLTICLNKVKIRINKDIYAKLYNRNKNDKEVACILLEYEIFEEPDSIRNMQGSLPDSIFDYLISIGIEYELFASPFFNHMTKFCSAFEIDKKFGSSGSFFDLKITGNKFFAQGAPPNGEEFLELVLNKIMEIIDIPNLDFLIILFLPDWHDYQPYNTLMNFIKKKNYMCKWVAVPKNTQIYETKHIYKKMEYITIPNSARIYILTNQKNINSDIIFNNIINQYKLIKK